MKKLFNHTKRPDQGWDEYEEDIDWDRVDDAEEAGTEYADEEMTDGEELVYEDIEDTYEAGEEEAGGEGYYAEEDAEGYYAEEDAEGYYAEEDAGGYYAEEDAEGYYAEEDAEGYYAEADAGDCAEDDEAFYAEDTEGEDGYWADEEADDYVADDYVEYASDGGDDGGDDGDDEPRKAGFFAKLMNMDAMDRIILGTGVTVLVLALVTGIVFVSAKVVDRQVSDFVTVGSQLQGINVIGERGLMAVADAEQARINAALALEEEEEEKKDYEESELNTSVTVKLDMVSVQKDLKIKFVNSSSGKLVPNVPFVVSLKTPDGKTEEWKDDDKDGIIYKKDITPGEYKVAIQALTDEKYKDYNIPTDEQKVTVKKDIEYKKIDVSNEVKKESEINAGKEDTKVNETTVESALQDTVQWVESTSTTVTYVEVTKSTIPDPRTLVCSKFFARMASAGGVTLTTLGQEASLSVSPAAETTTTGADGSTVKVTETVQSVTWSGGDAGIATVAADGKVKAVGNGTTTAHYSATILKTTTTTPAPSASDGNAGPVPVVTEETITATGDATITVNAASSIALDSTTATVFEGETVKFNASATGVANPSFSAASSDGNIATASANGNEITVTGVKKGSATITVTLNGTDTKATCAVMVKANPRNDRETKLKDASGKQLYVLEGNNYREAVYADYYTDAKFFVQGAAKYTGWQTLDGKVYFFDANGVKVTGEQVIQGARYNFASDGSLVTGSGTMGIDVSKWNGTIDWKAVKNSGVSYVIIRVGYRGSSEGKLVEDPKFASNIKGATDAGLKVGIYFFSQAVDEVEAVEEASMVIGKIAPYKISYPVFIDVEASNGRGDKIDAATRTAVCKAFCGTIQNAGYTAGVYSNKTWLNTKMNVNELSAYKIWLAQYAAEPTYTGRYDLWQYRSDGQVSGISGKVDMNISYLGY